MSRGAKVLLVTSAGVYLVSLDISVLIVAFGDVVADFGPQHQTLLAWVFSGYNIAFAAALLTAGRAADRFGRKRAWMVGVAIFVTGSMLCGIAPTAGALIAARVVQAIGGALVVPAALALVLPEFPVEKRSAAIGIWGAVGGLAAATGPTIGGLLVDHFGWRSVFFVNAPVCLVALVAGQRILRESREQSTVGVPDIVGALLAMSGVGILTLAVVQGEEWGWRSGRVAACVVGSIGLLAWFVLRCRRHPAPVLDLSLLRLSFFTGANLASFVFSMGFFAMFFTNTRFLQEAWGYSVVGSGLALTPGPAMAAAFAAPAGRWAQQRGHREIIVPGCVCFTVGIVALAVAAGAEADYWRVFLPAMMLTGIGVGLVISTLGSASNAYLPADRFAMGSAFAATTRQIGAALGIAVATALQASGDDLLGGYVRSWTFIAITAALAAVAMLALYRPPTPAQLAAATSAPA